MKSSRLVLSMVSCRTPESDIRQGWGVARLCRLSHGRKPKGYATRSEGRDSDHITVKRLALGMLFLPLAGRTTEATIKKGTSITVFIAEDARLPVAD